ncbi:MAG TPA: feruloyl-CoA synthase [Xanthobacteraceae bacterium]|jgi:feruloyl-CoA synthase|nr:feruloyl-CoA synthase [Xanthobacteraceae bacterium]
MTAPQQSALAQSPAKAPIRPIAYAPIDLHWEKAPDGALHLGAKQQIGAYDPSLAMLFRRAVELQPARVFLAERDAAGEWRTITYEAARRVVDSLAQALIDRNLSAERPVMILSGNSIDHALLMLAGFTAGVPVAPISVAYSLQSEDHAKLKHIADLLTPGLIYVADTAPFAKALAALNLAGVDIVASRNGGDLNQVTSFEALARITPGPAVESAIRNIGADTIAKFLFTSGSTSLPKGVINTHGMLTANQQQIHQIWPFLQEQPLVLVDWLPWNHTFGGNHNFNMVLRHAGTLYIDAGKPVPALVGETVRNLTEVSPTIYFNVPAGYAALLPHLEQDPALARSFFANLRLIFYAGAALPQDLWERLETIAIRTIGHRIPMTSSWGTTETAPMATAAHMIIERAGVIGVPAPGVHIKLVPAGSKLEVRVRGPNITPGYWKRPDLTAASFDEEGFYKPGDAVRFAAHDDPAQGIVFDGRLSEDFKLTTGTWVHVGALRVALLAAASPVLQDAIIAGENRDFIGVLAWLNLPGCQKLIGDHAPSKLSELASHPIIREHVRRTLAEWNKKSPGASQRVTRVLLLPDAPSIDANEITDKGYVNQRLALERRKLDVERLFAAKPDTDVIGINA